MPVLSGFLILVFTPATWARLGVEYQMALGNPDGAITDAASRTKYLLQRSQYALSYNDDIRLANWVSWSYSTGDIGADVKRTDAFAADTDLPLGFLRVGADSFGQVYDRGHLCPSEDRVFSDADNRMTFRMSNMMPQANSNNRGLWSEFENYCRGMATNSAVVAQNNEILIMAGPVVRPSSPLLFNGMRIPDSIWKIAVVVPGATSSIPAAGRINTSCRVIAILVPNQDVYPLGWESFIVPVEEIEAETGLNFFSNVEASTAVYLKNITDTGSAPNSPTVVTGFSPISGTPGTTLTLSGFNFGSNPVVDFNGVQVNGTPVPGNSNQITVTVPAGASTGTLGVTGTGGTDRSYGVFTVFTGTEPLYSLSSPSLTGLSSTAGKAGLAKSYTLSGANLSGPLNLQADAPFEIASASTGPFSNSLSVTPVSGNLAGFPVWVRIGSSGTEGNLSGSVSHTGGSAPTQTLQLSGTASSPLPKLTLSASSLGGLFASQGKAGLSKVYYLSGVNLSNPITVSTGSSTNFEISTNNSAFASSQQIQPVNEGLSNVPLYVRISSGAATGSISATMTHAGTGIPNTNLAVVGSVTTKQYLAAWDFFGESQQTSSTADLVDALLDNTNTLARGSGAGANNTAANSFRTSNFKNDGISTTNSDYFEFSLSAAMGKTLSITSVTAKFGGTSTFFASPGVTNQFAYSTNGTNFTLIGSPIMVTSTNIPVAFDFSGVPELQNLSADVTATLRYYASGQTSSGGWGFSSASSGDYGLAVDGKITSVPPVITSANTASGTARASFSYAITAENNPTFYAASGLPDGLSLDPVTGLITGIPTTNGVYPIQITASNDGGDGSLTLNLTILDPSIHLSTTDLAGLTSLVGSPGSSRTYILAGSSLTGSLTLTASAGFEISTDANTFASSLTLNPSNGALTDRTIYVRLSASAPLGGNAGTVGHAGGGALSRNLNLSGVVYQPTIQLSGASLSGMSSITGTVSGVKSYSVSGSNLTEAVSAILPANSAFEISTDGVSFSSSAMLLPSAGSLGNQTVYARLKASAPAGVYTEVITHSGGGASNQGLTLSGVVTQPPGSLTLSVTSLSGFSTTTAMVSPSQSYTVSGSGLTNVVRISASAGFEIATNTNSFAPGLTLNPTSGVLGATPVHVRIASNGSVGSVSGSIQHTSLGAVPRTLELTGSVLNPNRPVFTSSLFGAVYTNTSFSHALTATNPSGSASITYGASNLPAGWTVNSSSGTVSGATGSASTNLVFTVWAVNTNGTNFATYRLKVLSQADQDAVPLNVVINKYLNSTNGDRVELLITGDPSGDPPVDLRGMTLKDFSSTMNADGGGKFMFRDSPIWASVRAGTLITLSAGSRYTEDLDGSDYKISINLSNTNHLQSWGGSFDIGNTEMVMIKAAETGPDGVAGGIYALAVGNAGSQYGAFKGKKINGAQMSGTFPMVYLKNTASALADFVTSGEAINGSGLTFGSGNTPQNITFINSLQGLDQTGPVITLAGSNPMTLALGTLFSDPGATAMDSRNGARQVVVSGSVNHAIPGAYPISYSASDLSGNVSSVIRTVQVIDQTPPLLTLSGASSMQITLGSYFQDPGAFATDGWEGPLPFSVSGAVDTSSTGTYLLTYNAVDSAGNAAPEAVRTVQVLSALQSWINGFGLSGANADANADPDGDGLPNLAEYALGGVPTHSSGQLLPVVSMTNTNGTNWMRFSYRARTNDGTLIIQPVFKNNLTETNWLTNGVVQKVSGQPVGDGLHEDQVWQTPIGAETRRFLKLNISR